MGVVSLGAVAAWGFATWRDQAALDRAKRDASAGRYAAARDALARLAARRPGDDKVEFTLGQCEAALGHVEAALAAWGRVPARSPLSSRAAVERARLALAHGRLATVEVSLDRVSESRGPIADEASRLARQLDLFSGRSHRINARIEGRWRTTTPPVAELHTHWLIDTQPLPLAAMDEALERYEREAPDDDRVWLGRADLATRAGRYEDADAWLTKCEAKRPDDPDVWQVRLSWALETGRAEAASRALAHLPASRFSPAEIALLAARLAAINDDAAAERLALQDRVERAPGDAAAWKRLADLVAREGPAGAELQQKARRRKAEIDQASDHYRILMGNAASASPSGLSDLARTAETLGRRFEARGWWSHRLRQAPDDSEALAAVARLGASSSASATAAGKTLADVLSINVKSPAVSASPHAVPRFRDDAEVAGLTFVYDNDQTPLRRLPETMGGGLALIDYDGDGWLDVYAVQGGHFPPTPGANGTGGDRLFHNLRNGRFEDVTTSSGIAAFPRGFGHGVTVGDYDNDGHPDLFVTRWRSYALYRNKGDGTFDNVTAAAGLGGERGWPTSAAFADLDGDGDLDLYVCHYLHWDPDRSKPCADPEQPGRHVYCVPRTFEGEPDRLFRNDRGRFVDVTADAGITDRDGRGLGVVIADLDGDGQLDIFVANDMTANHLFRGLGGLRFEEVAEASGVASNGSGGYQAGMGIACGDINGDGLPDLVVTNFYGESVTCYQNLGGGLFADRTGPVGLAAPTRFVLGFGAFFLDADNDGRLDLALANGHVNDYRPAIAYGMPSQLFLGTPGGRFVDASTKAGACWSELRVGRGLAVGDVDNDGRQDVLILSQNSPLAYFRNLGPSGRHLTLRLEGTTSNRDGVGAVVRLTAAGATQTAWRLGGGSFLSASDGRLHFGLGPSAEAASVEVRWPNGRVDRHEGLKADGAYHLIEGDGRARVLQAQAAAH